MKMTNHMYALQKERKAEFISTRISCRVSPTADGDQGGYSLEMTHPKSHPNLNTAFIMNNPNSRAVSFLSLYYKLMIKVSTLVSLSLLKRKKRTLIPTSLGWLD